MPKWLLIVILLAAGLLTWKLLSGSEPAFDLDNFEKQVADLKRAAGIAKRMSDKGQLPDFLEVDVTYLGDVADLLQSGKECDEIADSVQERLQRYQSERTEVVDMVTMKDIMQMDRHRQREMGMQIIGHLAPAWAGLLEPVRDYCGRCPEESEVLTEALGTIQR